MIMRTTIKSLAIGLVAASSLATAALADGMDKKKGSLKDAAPADGRQFAWSVNMGATTDYVFRGFSQSKESAAVSAGADFTYGILYAGLWASTVDFGPAGFGTHVVNGELDIYAGIKPTWGPLTFDLGVIYYTYPGAEEKKTGFQELDYVELKAGVSGTIGKLALGGTVYYSPEYTNKQGEVWTLEGTAGYELPKVWIFTPTVGGTLGYQIGNNGAHYLANTGNGDDNYMYWNGGLALAVDKLTIDLRYWDTNVSDAGGFCSAKVFGCDERFVASVKFTLP